LAEIVTTTPDLVFLAKALEEAEILQFFESLEFEYTGLAPDNAAFNVLFTAAPELGKVIFDDEWILHLLDLLTMHVTEPTVLSSDLSDGQVIQTFNQGETLTVSTTDGVCFTPSVSGSSCVTTADVLAKNGVAHIIDDVLKPFWIDFSVLDIISGIPDLSTLLSLLECSGLDDALASVFGVTVFGPTNDAFVGANATFLCSDEGLPTLTDILTYHVLPSVLPSILIPEGTKDYVTLQGKPVTTTLMDSKDPVINDANIIAVDFGANNGIGKSMHLDRVTLFVLGFSQSTNPHIPILFNTVHVIDKILLPPAESNKGKVRHGCATSVH
jgi:transforming growth factor-beta-induced protein